MKFNLFDRKAATASNAATTVNHEGAAAFVLTPELELYAAVATSLLSDLNYEKADARLDRIRELVAAVDPEYSARLAVYARKSMNLRTVPVVLATELAKRGSGTDLVRRTLNQVVQRPDEITEILAYYQAANGRAGVKKLNRLSRQLQKGLADAFNRFDEYQFAKYDRKGMVTLRDAMFLVHPKPKSEDQQHLFKKIASQTLATPYTWETELSALSQQGFRSPAERNAAFRYCWEALIDSQRLGYMAMMRNLRNIVDAGVSPKHIELVCERLRDREAVLKSKQLPFRFLAAYREIKAMNHSYGGFILDSLEQAISCSVENMRGFDLDTSVVIACDVSGSMQKPVSAKSKILLYDIGLLLGMLLQSKCANVTSGIFGDSWKTVPLARRQVLENVDAFYKREGEVGYSTNGYRVIQDLIKRRHVADKIMMFTDTQLWDSAANNKVPQHTLSHQWSEYKKIAPHAKLYLFDLAGYGNVPLRMEGRDVALIAGWSDRVFEMLEAMEAGESALQNIRSLEL